MGAVLLMLLALVLPVAPASAAGAVGTQDDGIVNSAAVPLNLMDDCGPSTNDRTRYFLTLVSSTGARIPTVNGGTPANVSLIGVGTANRGLVVPMPVGDLENQAVPGVDRGSNNPPGGPNGLGPTNGSCLDIGDIQPGPLDQFVNDYGSPAVITSIGPTNKWDILITAAGHVSQLITSTEFLVDGIPAPLPAGFPAPLNLFGGTGCALTDRGCVVSLGTITLQALATPQAGRGYLSGTVRDINGLPLGGVEVVFYRQPDQDFTNDATGPIAEHTAASILTTVGTGQYFVNNLWPGRYSVTVADTRLLPCGDGVNVATSLSAICGIQPATKVVNVFPGQTQFPDPGQQQQLSIDFNVPTDMNTAQAPGQAIGGTTLTGLFGYVTDGSSGGRLGNLVPGQAGFNPNGGNGGNPTNPNQIQIVFTPTQPGGCPTGLNPAGGSSGCVGSVTAATDSNGRYSVVLVAGIQYAVSLTGGVPSVTAGLLPLGFTGSCTVGGNNAANDLFLCGVGATGQDRFTITTTSLLAGAWNGGGSFVLVPSTATQVPGVTGTVVRRLEAVIPGIFRNPDTSYTGVDVETVQVRVMNNGVQRTGAQIEWYSTSSDDVASLVKTDTLDLNAGATGIFTRSIIPDGCTRCMAQIFSIDLDAPTPFLGPGFLPTNTPAIPGTNGIVYGLSDLQATVTHRVVDAGNALAGGNGITYEDIIPTGNTNNSGYIIPLVYKNYGGGANKWNSIISGCLSRGVGGAQPIVFQFLSSGESRGGPFQITRSTNPGGCLVLNLNTFDPNDPDYFDPIAGLPDGTYSVVATSTAGTLIPTPPEVPGGFFTSSINYTTTGRMATMGNGSAPIGGENNVVGGIRELYAPLIFKRYNDWNSGISVAGFRPRTGFDGFGVGGGGSGAGISIGIYGEDGTLMGVFVDGVSRSSGARVYYLPTLPIQLPDGFRGSAIISVGDNTAGTRTGASVQTVNYERNQAMSYNFVTQDQVIGAPTPNARPCSYPMNSTTDPESPAIGPPLSLSLLPGGVTSTQYISCLSVPDAQRRFGGAPRGSGATFEVGLGPTTGVRLLNPDPFKTGAPAYVLASYMDSAGIAFVGSYTTFSIPAYHTATIFMGADTQLPDIYDGSMWIQATSPIAGMANVVDYRVTDRDASYAYNLPNQTGRTN